MEEIGKTFGVTAIAWQKNFSRIWTDPELYNSWLSPDFKSPEDRPNPELGASVDAMMACQLFPQDLSRFHNALFVLNSVMPVSARVFRVSDELYNSIRSAEIDGYSARERCFQDGKAKFKAEQSLSEPEKRVLSKASPSNFIKAESIYYDQMSFHMMNHWNRTVCLEKVKQTVFSQAHQKSISFYFGFLAVINECLGLAELEGVQPRTGQTTSAIILATYPLYGATAIGLIPSRKQGTLFVHVKKVPNLANMLALICRRLERVLSNYYEPDANAAELNPLIRPTVSLNVENASCTVELRHKTGKNVVFTAEILFSVPDAICHPEMVALSRKDIAVTFDDSLRRNTTFLLREYFILKHLAVNPDLRFTIPLILELRSISPSLRAQVSSWDTVMILWVLSQLAPLENPGVAMTRFFAVIEQGRVCKGRSPSVPFSALPMVINTEAMQTFFNVENFAMLSWDMDKIPTSTTNKSVVSEDTGVLTAIFKKGIEVPLEVEITLEQKSLWRGDQTHIRKYVLQKMIGVPALNQPQSPQSSDRDERRARSRSPRYNRDYRCPDRRQDRYRDQDRQNRMRHRSSSGFRGRLMNEERYDRRDRSRERNRERSRSREPRRGSEEEIRAFGDQVRSEQPTNVQANNSDVDSGVDSQRSSPAEEQSSSLPVHNYLDSGTSTAQPVDYSPMEETSGHEFVEDSRGNGYVEPMVEKHEKANVLVVQEPKVVSENTDVEIIGEVTAPSQQQLENADDARKNNDVELEVRRDAPSQFNRSFFNRNNSDSPRHQPRPPTSQPGEKRRSAEAFGNSEERRPTKQMYSPPQPTAAVPSEGRFSHRPNGNVYGQAKPSGASASRHVQLPGPQNALLRTSPSGETPNPPGTTLYVIEQRRGSNDQELGTLFSQFGEVLKVYSRPSGWHYNTDFAYVTFRHAASTWKALEHIQRNEMKLNGRSLLLGPDDNKDAKNTLYNSPNSRGRFDVCLRGLPVELGVKVLMECLTMKVNRQICHELDDICVQKGKGYALLSFKEAWKAENFLKTFEKKTLVLDTNIQAEVIIAPLSLRFDPLRPKPSVYPLPIAMCAPEILSV